MNRLHTLLHSLPACLAAGALLQCLPAGATHFRYGNLSWAPTAKPGEVEFRLTLALRRDDPHYGSFPNGLDQWAETGDIITEALGSTFMTFGDGVATPSNGLRLVVTAFSTNENWLLAEALDPVTDARGIRHTYAGSGPYMAGINDCCRLSANLNNRANGNYTLRAMVRPFAGNRSPVVSMIPVIVVPPGAPASFQIPAADPDGDGLRYRLATDAEAGGGSGPPGMSINPNTGLVTWANAGLDTNSFWTAQVIVEDLDATGAVKSTAAVDFLLKVLSSTNNPPVCALPFPQVTVIATANLGFDVSGRDADAGDEVILNVSGLPMGATMTPGLPLAGATT